LEPQNVRFGGGVAQTFLSPVVLIAIMVAGLLICFAGRKKALGAFLAAAILIPPDQVLLLGGVHFPMLRILSLCGLARIGWAKFRSPGRIFKGGLNGIDIAMIGLGSFVLIDGCLLWQEWGEVVFQLGNMLTILGVYFSLRFLIQDEEEIRHAIRVLACVAALVGFVMVYEHATGRNLVYSTLGGARAGTLGMAIDRDDHLRAAGTFGHPILAGTFGGILLPLFIGLWVKEKKDRKFAALGVVSSITISIAASSSTALFGLLGGILGLCFWPLRRQMRFIRWGIVGTLVSLHMYMRMPVWHLISDIDLTGNSSSYHRYQLINQCILHFWDWMAVGTKNYADWGWDMWDLSDQYVATANQYGLIPIVCFVAVIVLGFRYMGNARRTFKRDRGQVFFAWALGASLFANVVAFFGTSYWDQTIVAWYAILGMMAVITVSARREQRALTLKQPENPSPEPDFQNSDVQTPSLVTGPLSTL